MGTYTGSDKRLQYLFQNGGGGGASALSDLSDVELTNLANNQIIKYNSTTQKWENANESGGGGSANNIKQLWSGALNTLNGTLTLSESYKHFDLLIVKWSAHATVDYYQGNEVIPTAEIVENQTYQFGDSFYRSTGQYCQMAFSITNETTLTLDQIQLNGANAGVTIQAVYGLCVGGSYAEHFSTEEQVIGTWTDGKPIYRITLPEVSFGTTDVTYTHNLGIKQYINVYGSCTINGTNYPKSFPFYQHKWNHFCEINNFYENDISFSSDWNNNKATVTLEYTKIADYT